MNMRTILTTTAAVLITAVSFPSAHADEQSIANVVNQMVEATRSTYDSLIVKKLQNDGAGAAKDHTSQIGFAPDTESFLRRIAFDAIAKSKRSSGDGFSLGFAPGGKGVLTVKVDTVNLSPDDEAMIVAKVLDRMMRSIRGTYTAMVVRKLQKDGSGASIEYTKSEGFIPLPAVFVRNIATIAISGQSGSTDSQFTLSLRSRWNLNPGQSLQDKFELDGWSFLANQQSTHTASGQSLRNFSWTPYAKTQNTGGTRTLRYLSADTAANQSCVTCHNTWEQREDTKAIRIAQSVEPGKTFELHELMGIVSISVNLPSAK